MRIYIKIFLLITLAFISSNYSNAQVKDAETLQLPEATTLNNLSFGTLITGTAREVLITDPSAAKFYLKSGVAGEYVVKLVLPRYISNGRRNIPVKFHVTHASWSFENNAGTSTTFDPNQDLTVNPVKPGTPIYIWVGGAINADADMDSGPFTGVITLSITKK